MSEISSDQVKQSVTNAASTVTTWLSNLLDVTVESVKASWKPINYPAFAVYVIAGALFSAPIMHKLDEFGLVKATVQEKINNAPLATDQMVLTQVQSLATRQKELGDSVNKRVDEIKSMVAGIQGSNSANNSEVKASIESLSRQVADINDLAGQLAKQFAFGLSKPAADPPKPAAVAPEPQKKPRANPPAAKSAPPSPSTTQPANPSGSPPADQGSAFPWLNWPKLNN